MSSTDEKPGLFNLKNTNYNPQLFYVYSLTTFLIFLGNVLIIYYSLKNFVAIALLPIFLVILIYLVGVSYSEYKAKFDFIKTTTSGVEFHHSPKVMHMGWLPKKGVIRFNEIQTVNVIQIKSGFNLLEERMNQAKLQADGYVNSVMKRQLLLEITKKDGKIVRIGERLPSSGLIQVAILIESGAKLGNLFSSFAEKFPNATNMAKNFYSKIFKKGN